MDTSYSALPSGEAVASFVAQSAHEKKTYPLMHFIKGAAAGGICCSVTHAALTPVDVAKTRIQQFPQKYQKGLVGTMRQVVKEEGIAALTTGLQATAVGYFVQGWFKFGGVEISKIKLTGMMSEETAWNNRTGIYLVSAAMAEFVADLFLCPLEAVRIRSVSDVKFPKGLAPGFLRMFQLEGISGFYAGLGPILFKQIPYTMAKFAVQGKAAEMMYTAAGVDATKASAATTVGFSLASGVVAGVAAAIVSHPADTLLSKVNVAGAGGEGSIPSRLIKIAGEMGFVRLATTGLGARCVMIGALTAGQFAIFDSVMAALGAEKFHFHDPNEGDHEAIAAEEATEESS